MSKRWWRPARLVFLTVQEDADFARAALDAGGLGYVVKARLASDLLGSFPANGTGLAVGGGLRYLAALLDIQLNFRNSRMACSMKSSANCFGVMPQAAASAAIAL